MRESHFIEELIDILKKEDTVFIQPHNYPDHDGVASAFGLQSLFKFFDIKSHLVYEGEIQRDSLKQMIDSLDIEIHHISEYNMNEQHKIVVVDGCKGNKNVTDLIGDEIAVIDHHLVKSPEDVPLSDIRPDYGACASIISSYYDLLNIDIPQKSATALIIGIVMDTALLTRGTSEQDVSSYSNLYSKADMRLVNSILRNFIQIKDLHFYKEAINNVQIKKEVAFCHFPNGCNQNLLGILGDFFLALQEIDFVILSANNGGLINFSLRNERDDWNAAAIIQEVLKGIGFGGGHADMAGGIIPDSRNFSEEKIKNLFYSSLFGLNTDNR
ncbi:MAG TPA: DHHA1 domain-containing protein [Spirochaetota bacterium]|nr:DHHA1 domain-containing protein [Spirochaetota bacterium]